MKLDLLTLANHQREGLAACLDGFRLNDRQQVHMACGTGKTRLGQAVAASLGSKHVLVLFPSLPLLSQTLEAWIEESHIAHQDILCICSDLSVVDPDEDDHIVSQPIEVTTTPSAVAAFFEGRAADGNTVIFSTYHSLPALASGLPSGFVIDLCIFDEAHRVVGEIDKGFSYGLKNHPDLTISKRLFMTATPKIFDMGEDDDGLVYSMADESIFGPVAYVLSLHEAIERGIVCDYHVILSIHDESLVDEPLEESPDQDLIFKAAALVQSMSKIGASKAFTFHQRISYSKRFNEALKLFAAHKRTRLDAWHVDGKMSEGERHAVLRSFSGSDFGVVSCSRCLSEGTNVPVTDLVAFMDPRSSDTDIIQTLGRALRKAPGKARGYVLIPLKLAKGTSVEDTLRSSSMQHIWKVLGSIAEMDASYIKQLRQIRRSETSGRSVAPGAMLLDKVVIDASSKLMEDAYKALRHQVIDRMTSRWDSSFGELLRYLDLHGHLNVPKKHTTDSGLRLGVWCSTQRMLSRNGMLSSERRADLLEIGFDFDPHGTNWEHALGRLKAYANAHGHSIVPQSFVASDGLALGSWCSEQRKAFKQGKLDPEREGLLRGAGFSFSPAEESWMRKYSKLKGVYETKGSLGLDDLDDRERIQITKWLSAQRSLPEGSEKRRMLEAMGLSFQSKFDDAWEEALNHFKAYIDLHAGRQPPLSHKTECGLSLGAWVSNQRQAYASGGLSHERVSKLKSAGFVFNIEEAAFEKGLAELAAFRAEKGHFKVPAAYATADGYKLGAWWSNVRGRLKKNPEDRRVEKLRSIGAWEG